MTFSLSGCDALNEFLGGLGLDGGGSTNGDDPVNGEDPPPAPPLPLPAPNPGDTVVEITGPGESREWTPSVDGYYLIELWGSQGWNPTTDSANQYGGRGAYARGVLEITPEDVSGGQPLYVTVGVGTDPSQEGYGGGASDVRWGADTLYDRIIVAAGGGGSHDKERTDWNKANGKTWTSAPDYSTGGYGGALIGGNGSNGRSGEDGRGASQTAGGAAGNKGVQGAFGTGGYIYSTTESIGCGGYGYWGGGSGGIPYENGGGGGGSSFISGYVGCVAIITNGETGPRDGADNSVQKATHYSGKIFSPTVTIGGIDHETVMIAGNAPMPTPAGGAETGHSGGGYARVIYLGKPSIE